MQLVTKVTMKRTLEENGPLCECQAPAVQRTVVKDGQNKGRIFWTCGTRTCKHFAWDDMPGPKGARGGAGGAGGDTRGFGGTVRNAQNAVITRNPACQKQPIDIQVVGYGALMKDLDVPSPALQVSFPREGTDDLVKALTDIQGVTPLHIDTEQGIRLYREQDYNAISEVFRKHPQYDVLHPPASVFNAVITEMHRKRPEMEWSDCDIPLLLQKKLMPFQREGVEYAVRRGGKVLIGDEMGLGKTIQAIALMSYYRKEWPALVIVPSGLKFVWYSAVLAELPYLNPDLVQVVATSKEELRGMLCIMSYDICSRNADAVMKKRFRVVCLDEAHSIKNDRSQRFKNIRPILQNADRLVLLTGTPALNRPIELYTQVECLLKQRNHIFCNKKEFGQRYCDLKTSSFGIGLDWKGHANLQELQYVLRLTCMIRREKAMVLHELPEKRRAEVHVTINDKEMKLMDASLNKLKDRFRSLDEIALVDEAADGLGAQASGKTVLKKNQVVHLFNATSKAKQQPVCEYIEQSYSTGEKVLVFAHHIDMLNAIESCVVGICRKHNADPQLVKNDGMWDHVRIDGSVAALRKKELADHFQDNKQCKFAILSILACGVGLTFHSSSTVIFAELYWTPGQLVQAEDRVHRIGQKDQCSIKYILAQNTSDDLLWPLLNRKLAVLGAALNKRDEEGENKETWTEEVKQFHRQAEGRVLPGTETATSSFMDKNTKKPKTGAKQQQSSNPSMKQGTLADWGVKRDSPNEQTPPAAPASAPAPLAVPPLPVQQQHQAPASAHVAFAPTALPMNRPQTAPPPSKPQAFVPSNRPVAFVPNNPPVQPSKPVPFVPPSSIPAAFVPHVPQSNKPQPFAPSSKPVPFSPAVSTPVPFASAASLKPVPFVPAPQTPPSISTGVRPSSSNSAPANNTPTSLAHTSVPSPCPMSGSETSPQKRRRRFTLLAGSPQPGNPAPPVPVPAPAPVHAPACTDVSPSVPMPRAAASAPPVSKPVPFTPALAGNTVSQSTAPAVPVVPVPVPASTHRSDPVPFVAPALMKATVSNQPVPTPARALAPPPAPVAPAAVPVQATRQGHSPDFNPYVVCHHITTLSYTQNLLERTSQSTLTTPKAGGGDMKAKLLAVAFKKRKTT